MNIARPDTSKALWKDPFLVILVVAMAAVFFVGRGKR